MALELVDQMTEQPGACILCGGNPPGPDGQTRPAIHAVGLDVNWGDSVYVCGECADLIADLIGRVDEKEHKALQHDYRKLSKAHAKLTRQYRELKNRTRRIVDGERAKKEVKSA